MFLNNKFTTIWFSLVGTRQLSQLKNSKVVNLTTALYCNWLSCLTRAREEIKWITTQVSVHLHFYKKFLLFLSLTYRPTLYIVFPVIVIVILAMFTFYFCPKLQDNCCRKHYDYDYAGKIRHN